MDPAFHFAGPFQKAPQFAALAPYEFPEFQESNLRHLHARVGFNAPQKIGTSPRSEPMPLRRIPQKAELGAHARIS